MDLSLRKYYLIEKVQRVKDEDTISQLEAIFANRIGKDFWNELPCDLQELIEKEIQNCGEEQKKCIEEVMEAVKKKYESKE